MSAPQVAGAAALYRSARGAATAQETRAALLLCTIDPFLPLAGYTGDDMTYTGRNTIGTALPLGLSVPVFVAARDITSDVPVSKHSVPGYVARLPQEAACSSTVADQRILHVLPDSYKYAYGSRGVANTGSGPNYVPTSVEPHTGFILASPGTQDRRMGLVYSDAVTDGAPYTVRALAFRSWKPLLSCSTTLTFWRIYMWMGPPGPQAPPTSAPPLAPVASNVQVVVDNAQWTARGPDTWPIIVPLDTPFPVTSGGSLLMWLEVRPSSCQFEVDGTMDPEGVQNPPWAHYASSLGTSVYDGEVPVLGIIEHREAELSPDLIGFGFPVINRHFLFQSEMREGVFLLGLRWGLATRTRLSAHVAF